MADSTLSQVGCLVQARRLDVRHRARQTALSHFPRISLQRFHCDLDAFLAAILTKETQASPAIVNRQYVGTSLEHTILYSVHNGDVGKVAVV